MNKNEQIVGAHIAKTNLGQLLTAVESGAAIVVTRHGVPIAKIIPYESSDNPSEIEKTVASILQLQQKHTLGGTGIEELLHAGHEL